MLTIRLPKLLAVPYEEAFEKGNAGEPTLRAPFVVRSKGRIANDAAWQEAARERA